MRVTTTCFQMRTPWCIPSRSEDTRKAHGKTVQSPLEAAARYVSLANSQDRSGLLAMLAHPCDMFGEPVTRDDIDGYFEHYQDVHFEITKEFQVTPDDPNTVEFEYIKSWTKGGCRMQVEVGEFVTFTTAALEGWPKIVRIGYTRPPADPIIVPDDEFD
mmetsp:Transcript_56812/g.159514  ORF Transcript_56812/g.159514 Transcript_56812/m.159514 type:complete len:159 (-) Transcript_56812:99-575(-)